MNALASMQVAALASGRGAGELARLDPLKVLAAAGALELPEGSES